MRVKSSMLKPGSTTPVHTHPGPEVIYIVDGEQCMETPRSATVFSPANPRSYRTVAFTAGGSSASGVRRALALNLYDAAHPASHDLADPPPLVPCK